jgi:hypothetical protein
VRAWQYTQVWGPLTGAANASLHPRHVLPYSLAETAVLSRVNCVAQYIPNARIHTTAHAADQRTLGCSHGLACPSRACLLEGESLQASQLKDDAPSAISFPRPPAGRNAQPLTYGKRSRARKFGGFSPVPPCTAACVLRAARSVIVLRGSRSDVKFERTELSEGTPRSRCGTPECLARRAAAFAQKW